MSLRILHRRWAVGWDITSAGYSGTPSCPMRGSARSGNSYNVGHNSIIQVNHSPRSNLPAPRPPSACKFRRSLSFSWDIASSSISGHVGCVHGERVPDAALAPRGRRATLAESLTQYADPRRRRSSCVLAGRCRQRWRRCWWGPGCSPCRPVRRPPRAVPGSQSYTAGAPGAGDPYFPFAGNGGYDVQHYDLDLTYTPPAPAPAPLVGQPPSGVATIDPGGLQDLDRFNLDLRGLDVQAITVTGSGPARWRRPLPGPRSRARRTGRCRDVARGQGSRSSPAPRSRRGEVARRRHLRRCDHPADRHQGRPLRLGDDAGRRDGGAVSPRAR